MSAERKLTAVRVVDATGNPLASAGGQEPLIDENGVLYHATAAVCSWAMTKLGAPPVGVLPHALGILREGIDPNRIDPFKDLIAAAIFFNYYSDNGRADVQVSVVSEDILAARPDAIRAVLDYAFGQLKVRRISAEIEPSNKRSIGNAIKLGFRHEGTKPEGGAHGGDMLMFGLLPKHCGLLGGNPNVDDDDMERAA